MSLPTNSLSIPTAPHSVQHSSASNSVSSGTIGQHEPLQNSFNPQHYNAQFSCASVLSTISDDQVAIKHIFAMHNVALESSLQNRITALQKHKLSKLGKKEIKPTLSILYEEVERRSRYFLESKVPSCKSWPAKDLYGFLGNHPLPSSENTFLISKIEAFVVNHKVVLKNLLDDQLVRRRCYRLETGAN